MEPAEGFLSIATPEWSTKSCRQEVAQRGGNVTTKALALPFPVGHLPPIEADDDAPLPKCSRSNFVPARAIEPRRQGGPVIHSSLDCRKLLHT